MLKRFVQGLMILLAAGRGERAIAAQEVGPRAAIADSAGLVRAVSAVVTDSLVPRYRRLRGPLAIETPHTPFDSATALILRAAKGVDAPVREGKSGTWAGTAGFILRGDTAAVMVVVRQHDRDRSPISTYIAGNRYLFVRGPAGWRYVRREFVRGLDIGGVPG